jgi:hypothetical protein
VSPKSGCAVSDIAAVGWEKKLLVLPQFLLNKRSEIMISRKEFEDAFKMTGYFLKKWLLPVKSFNTDILFEARRRLLYSLE